MNYSLLIFILLLLIYNKMNTDTDIVYFYDKESEFVKKEHGYSLYSICLMCLILQS